MKNKKTFTTDWAKIKILRNPKINWSENEKGVLVEISRDTFIDRICQKWFKTPRVSTVQMDSFGSFFWKTADGSCTVTEIASKMEKEFAKENEEFKDALGRASRFALQLQRAKLAELLIKAEGIGDRE